MDTCGNEILCGLFEQLFDGFSPNFVNVVKVTFYITLCFSFYKLGECSGRIRRESFINGIMYYINIQAFNAANIPENIDENTEEHVKEAKARLARKIMPRVPG